MLLTVLWMIRGKAVSEVPSSLGFGRKLKRASDYDPAVQALRLTSAEREAAGRNE